MPARLTDGREIYPHRPDLADLPFWRCPICHNHVGCHHKTSDRTKPLGCIPTRDMMVARKRIHSVLDPLWKNAPRTTRTATRRSLYGRLSKVIGREYHTADLRSMAEANQVLAALRRMGNQ